MPRLSFLLSLLLAATACAQTTPDANTPPLNATQSSVLSTQSSTQPAPAPEILSLLQLLEDRGGTLKDFTAKLRYAVDNPRSGNETNRGQVAYIKDPATARVALVLDDLIVDGVIAKTKLDHRISFDGETLKEIDPPKKIFRIVPLAKTAGGVKPDPFRLRGPLPMPIGQKVADVLADFSPALLPSEEKTDPANTAHLRLTPLKADVYDFKQLDLFIDSSKDIQLPVKLIRTALDDTTTTITLRDLKINTGDAQKLPIFSVEEPKDKTGWQIDDRTK